MIRIVLTAALAASALAGTATARSPERTSVSWHADTGRYCIRWSKRDAGSVMGARLYGRECRSAAAWQAQGVTFTHRPAGRVAT